MSLGLSPSDSKMLLEYPDVEYFIEEYQRIRHNEDIRDQLKLAEAIRMGNASLVGKEGAKAYNNWVQRKKSDFKKRKEVKKETAFQILKRNRKKKSLLDKIKGA